MVSGLCLSHVSTKRFEIVALRKSNRNSGNTERAHVVLQRYKTVLIVSTNAVRKGKTR